MFYKLLSFGFYHFYSSCLLYSFFCCCLLYKLSFDFISLTQCHNVSTHGTCQSNPMSSFPHLHLSFFFDILVFLLIFWGVPHLLSGPDPSLPLLCGVAEVAKVVAAGHQGHHGHHGHQGHQGHQPHQPEDTELDQHLWKSFQWKFSKSSNRRGDLAKASSRHCPVYLWNL